MTGSNKGSLVARDGGQHDQGADKPKGRLRTGLNDHSTCLGDRELIQPEPL